MFIPPADTYIDAKAEHGNSRRLTEGEQQEQQRCDQLHDVEEMIVHKEVGSQRFGILGVREELVVVLSFLRSDFKTIHRKPSHF